MTTLADRATETTLALEEELLFREAKRRERRRRLTVLALLVVLLGGSGLGYAIASNAKARPHRLARGSANRTEQSAADYVTPKDPEALAVGPEGDLFIVDSGRNQILKRLPNGRFLAIAGTGKRGFSGDGGLATRAEIHLEYDAGIAVSKDGTVFFSDSWNSRVREILPDGIIETIAGGGKTPLAHDPVSALSASLGSGLGYFIDVGGLTIGPQGDLYMALPSGVYQLGSDDRLHWVVGGQVSRREFRGVYVNPAIQEDFLGAARLAFDRAGDLYVAGGGGWGLYERAADGALHFVEVFRGDGAGFFGSLASDPNGSVVAVSNSGLQRSTAAGSMVPLTDSSNKLAAALDAGLGRRPYRVPTGADLNTFDGGEGIAVGADGTVYTDVDAGGYSQVSGLLAVNANGRVTTLWKSSR